MIYFVGCDGSVFRAMSIFLRRELGQQMRPVFFYDDVKVVQLLVDFAADVVYLATQSLDALFSAPG
jgi:hypothetical protein